VISTHEETPVLHAMRRLLAVSAVTALAGVGLLAATSAPAGAQVYPPNGCTLGASVSVTTAGSSITVTGSGFDAGPVTIFFDETQVATTTAGAEGTISATFTIPANASQGTHVIRAVPAGAKCDPTTTITVEAAAGARGPARGGALPFTGSDSLPLVWIALALLTVGTALVLAVRRRAQTRRSLSS
jgi:hypothetical protein